MCSGSDSDHGTNALISVPSRNCSRTYFIYSYGLRPLALAVLTMLYIAALAVASSGKILQSPNVLSGCFQNLVRVLQESCPDNSRMTTPHHQALTKYLQKNFTPHSKRFFPLLICLSIRRVKIFMNGVKTLAISEYKKLQWKDYNHIQ